MEWICQKALYFVFAGSKGFENNRRSESSGNQPNSLDDDGLGGQKLCTRRTKWYAKQQ